MSDDQTTPINGIEELSAETIRNAISTEVKERFGEDFFVRSAIVVAIVERPRGELEKPNAPRVSLFLKSLMPIHPSIAINMMKEAAKMYQVKKTTSGESQ
ncbi:hypothetical protein SEA_EMIANNA_18 [Gordonia phage Emianna]|uniref:Uncharacterized protein n=3 Tax=Foxborovirus TaxID=2948710 RepID=A0A385UCC9_9CAUD|nr:hypothetical protein KNU10_gp19 [Gordonia phage Foxboro]YP_010098366.1 hypothetical protein KNU11_gp18 [Gordonia phage KidneyBean]YP_010098906.1 hypothetical protein KNU15_gp18 [Gordonia phage Emianna]AYD84290.1 hypothetical protein SEA_KURT_18 [Gordonia phage Kurt]AYB69151.1 hypothetical protein SEA_FOXBORO_19 [Gordonia phage Foxboro]AYB69736.1 hypothetical protein SEA_KIDNEYBEAN_18 [Gordonia phage KidneyBean]AYD83403.1 hypothetical protein SEA_EMIANNA_18 [Gordonia phage Emianna]